MQRIFWEFDGQIMKEIGWVQTGSSGASWDQMFLRYGHSNIHYILLKLFFITIFWLCLSFDFNIYLCSLYYPNTLYWNVNSYFLTIFTDPSFFWISTRLMMCGILIYWTHNLVIYFSKFSLPSSLSFARLLLPNGKLPLHYLNPVTVSFWQLSMLLSHQILPQG